MVPAVTRRKIVAGALGLGALGVGSTQVRIGPVESWRPEPGTWPHERRGPRNAAANARASPPSEPTVAWQTKPLERVDSLVVGPDRVYVGGEWQDGGGVAALDRDDGTITWTRDLPVATLALRGGTLYAGARWLEGGGVLAIDAATGEERWRTSIADVVVGLLVADGTVFAAAYEGLAAVDADSGRVRWSGLADNAFPAVVDGALLVAGGDVQRHRSRRASDVLTGAPPPIAWVADVEKYAWPVVADGRVVVGTQAWSGSDDPGLYAFDVGDGTRLWRTVDPLAGPDPVVAGPPAASGSRGFFGLRHGEESNRTHELVACSLDDGAVRWRRDLGNWVTRIVVAGETVLAATAADRRASDRPQSVVRAFAPDGQTRWRFETGTAVRGLAAVEGTVFVGTGVTNGGTASGVVTALR